MRKQQLERQLETVIGKLMHLNYHMEGNQLQTTQREVADVLERVRNGDIKIKKLPK